MGVDASMLIRPHEPLSSEALEELRDAFHEAFSDEFHDTDNKWFPDLKPFRTGWGNGHPPPDDLLIEVVMLNRYFGPGVHRGGWPWIRDIGDWLMLRFGETAELRYGSDTTVEWDAMHPWPQARTECDALWNELVASDPSFAETEAAYREQRIA